MTEIESRKRKKATLPCVPSSTTLRSTRRDDGLWESIEVDDGAQLTATSSKSTSAQTMPSDSHIRTTRSPRFHMKSTGTQTSTQTTLAPSPPPSNPPETLAKPPCGSTTTSEETVPIARPPQYLFHHPVDTNQIDTVPVPPTFASGATKRRGRPKKTVGFRNVRSMRFSDPIPPESESGQISRDLHVFVRLLRVSVEPSTSLLGGARQQRQEFTWNNRAKGWKAPGRRSDEAFSELQSLFEVAFDAGAVIHPVVLPTEQGGVRPPVVMFWDAARCCFLGVNQDGQTLSVTLGEMRDMAKDPWARQFVGFMLG